MSPCVVVISPKHAKHLLDVRRCTYVVMVTDTLACSVIKEIVHVDTKNFVSHYFPHVIVLSVPNIIRGAISQVLIRSPRSLHNNYAS